MYRWTESQPEVFLVHPGGPLWANKDRGAWTLPKGEYEANEDPLLAAQREIYEETGFIPTGTYIGLQGTVLQSDVNRKVGVFDAFLAPFGGRINPPIVPSVTQQQLENHHAHSFHAQSSW